MINLHESVGPGRDRICDPGSHMLPEALPTALRGHKVCIPTGLLCMLV